MRSTVMLFVAILIPLNGCESLFTHKLITGLPETKNEGQQDPGPITTKVSVGGKYALMCFEKKDDIPLAIVHLKRGDLIGFQRDNDQLVAVAGKQKYPIPDGSFGWVIVDQKPEALNWHTIGEGATATLENLKDATTVTTIVVVCVCVVAGALVFSSIANDPKRVGPVPGT